MAEVSQNVFTGGMDKDTDPRYVAQGDFIESLNNRAGYTNGANQGSIENVKGNTLVDVPFPSGVTGNTCIGAHEDITNKKIYFFTVNSNETAGGCVFEYDQVSGVVTLLLTDNGLATPVLNFSRNYLINHADAVNGILYWTDGNNPPRKLNIERAKTNGYPTPFIEQYIDAVQYPPVEPPSGSYATDTSVFTNNLRGKLFQFKTTFVYEDKEESAPSPTSKLIVPSSSDPVVAENLSNYPYGGIDAPDELGKNNLIELSFYTGSAYVKRIRIYTRVGNESDWYLYDDLDKAELSIADDSFLLYNFYNDKALLQVDQEIIDRPFDEVPLKAKCQSFIDGNRLVYTNITKGYENVSDLNVSITPVYEASHPVVNIGGNIYPWNDVVKTLKRNSNYSLGIVYSDDAGRTSFVQSNEDMNFRVKSLWETPNNKFEVGLNVSISHLAPSWAKYYEIVLTNSLSIGRFFTMTLSPGRIKSPPTGANAKQIYIILDDLNKFNEYTQEGAITYSYTQGDRIRFLYRDYNTVLNNLAFITKPIDLAIKRYDEGLNAIFIPYSQELENIFLLGSGGLKANTSFISIEIYNPILENEQNIYYSIGEKRRVVNRYHQGKFGFQTAIQPAQLELRDIGDAYYRDRRINYDSSTQSAEVNWVNMECPNFSDFYPSTFWDRGNANIVDKNQGQQELVATSVYSEPIVFESDVNGLSTFLNASFKDYDRRYGAVNKTYSEDKRLLLFQELKVSQALINENILYDSDNNAVGTVGQQSQVLNENVYFNGEFGIGDNPESFTVYGKVKYFTDAARGAVLRLSQDGLTKISDYKMHNYFTDLLRNVVNSNTQYYIHGVYDIRFEEYVLSVARKVISEAAGEAIVSDDPYYGVTIGFSEPKNRWVSKYSYEPEYMVQNQTDIISFRAGKLYTHNTSSSYNNFYGVQYNNTITFISNPSPEYVKAWQNIVIKSNAPMAVIFRNETQVSNLLESDFELREGRYYSTLLRDINTPNVDNPIFEGDQLRSDYISVELIKETDLDSFFKLFMVAMQYRQSQLSK